MDVAPGAGGVSRAVNLLLSPGRGWDRIAWAPTPVRPLFLQYALPLAAIPSVCGAVGVLAFGFNIANIGVRMSLLGLALGAAVNFASTLLGAWLLALFVDLVAPAFGGVRGREAALNLVVYAATASWLGGLSELYPSLGISVGILAGLYSLCLLYVGLPKMMGVPEARRLPAYAAVLVALLVLVTLRGVVTAKAAELGGPLSASYAPR